MSEMKCVVCGSVFGALVNEITQGNRVCWECVDKAVEQALKVKRGDAVVIEKKGGEWPDVRQWTGSNDEGGYDHEVSFEHVPFNKGDSVIKGTYQEAAEAWNNQTERPA
jgi:co-chaperonin GroES (HSP10)